MHIHANVGSFVPIELVRFYSCPADESRILVSTGKPGLTLNKETLMRILRAGMHSRDLACLFLSTSEIDKEEELFYCNDKTEHFYEQIVDYILKCLSYRSPLPDDKIMERNNHLMRYARRTGNDHNFRVLSTSIKAKKAWGSLAPHIYPRP
jgi:hypothetical protein